MANFITRKFYVWKFIEGFFFIYPIQAIFLLSRGITPIQLAFFASLTAISSTLLEIPTGYIADKYSRKLSVSLGFLSQAMAYLLMIAVHDFVLLIPTAILLGLGASLLSGSVESLIYDSLLTQERDKDFLKINSKGSSISTLTGALGTLIGPMLYVVNPSLPFMLTSLVLTALSLFVATIRETKITPLPSEIERGISIFDGIKNILKIKPILLITLADTILLIFVNLFYQVLYFPKLDKLGFPTSYLGVLDVVNLLLMTVMLLLVPKMTFKSKRLTFGIYTVLVAAVFVGFSHTTYLMPALIMGVLFDLVWTARKHVIPIITNPYFTVHNRSLSISSMSFVSNLGAACLVPASLYLFNQSFIFTLLPFAVILTIVLIPWRPNRLK